MNLFSPAGSASPANDAAAPRQLAVYATYLALHRIAAELASSDTPHSAPLALACGMDAAGAEAAIASKLAGASFLGIDASLALQKSAQRSRACDFLVNSTSEALRMLKLALRKSQPIAVGLLADPVAALEQLCERGVQPQFLFPPASNALSTEIQNALTLLTQRGARSLHVSDAPALPDTESLVRWTAATPGDLRHIDALVLDHLSAEETPRRRWLQHAPTYFLRPSPPERIGSLTAEEFSSLQAALLAPTPFLLTLRAALHGPAELTWTDASAQTHTLRITP